MHTISIDFDVFKQLTLRRATEEVTHNDVLRELLDLPPVTSVGEASTRTNDEDVWVTQGVRFPSGTRLRKTYKGVAYTCEVDGAGLRLDGRRYNSLSSAASALTGGPVNGWRFWECQRPGENGWVVAERLRN